MTRSEIIEYHSRRRMEETTARVFARLQQVKSILCKTLKSRLFRFSRSFLTVHRSLETSCGTRSNLDDTGCMPKSFYSETLTVDEETSLENVSYCYVPPNTSSIRVISFSLAELLR